jgi:DNA-binding Xre family transcriptional regulator
MSIYQLAQRTGLAYPTVHRLVRKPPRRIDMSTLASLCEALECSLGDLLVYEPPEGGE